MNNKNELKNEKSNIIIKHQYYKSSRFKKIKKIINPILFIFYIISIAIIVNLTNENQIKEAHAKSIKQKEIKFTEENSYFNVNELSIEEKLIINYYVNYIGNKDIALLAYKYSKLNKIDTSLLVAIMKVESNFNPKAINYNKNGSIDRGLCQLNSYVYPYLKSHDFFDIETNIKYGASHIAWCLKESKNNIVKSLALYNAGWGNVSKKKVGDITLNYIELIINERDNINKGLELYLYENSDLLKEVK